MTHFQNELRVGFDRCHGHESTKFNLHLLISSLTNHKTNVNYRKASQMHLLTQLVTGSFIERVKCNYIIFLGN